MSNKPIEIDLTGLQSQFGLTQEQVDLLTETCVNAVSASIYANWLALAKQRLRSTAPEYTQNLIKVDKGRFEKSIVLTGVLPNMIEQGASPFDMKQGFKSSPKVKHTIQKVKKKGNSIQSAGGWYLTIPFRIGTPNAVGQAGFANVMPEEVYAVAKKLGAGQRLNALALPEGERAPRSRAAITDESGAQLFGEYRHKNSIYDGMMRSTFTYNKSVQSMYHTFRRVSDKSDAMSWVHSGFKALWLSTEAVEKTDADTLVENEVYNYLEQAL